MRRMALLVDSPGDSVAVEPGYNKRVTAREAVDGGAGHGVLINTDLPAPGGSTSVNLWCPPQSNFILPRPLQFDPDWTDHTHFTQHLVTKDNWSFNAGNTPATPQDADLHSSPVGGTTSDTYMLWTYPSAVGGDPIAVDFTAIMTAVGRADPGFMVGASTVGGILEGVTPCWHWNQYPAPYDAMIFGFGDMCIYTDAEHTYLLRCPFSGGFPTYANWELLWSPSYSAADLLPTSLWQSAKEWFYSASWRSHQRSLMVIPVGWEDLFLVRDAHSPPWIANVQKVADKTSAPFQIKQGPWWVAGVPDQPTLLQVQTMGYHFGSYLPTGAIDTNQEWFNLGQDYAPDSGGGTTQDPQLFIDLVFPVQAGTSSVPTIVTAGIEYRQSPDNGQIAAITVLDENSADWVSDGTHFRGTFKIELGPPTDNTTKIDSGSLMTKTIRDCWCPQLQNIFLKFAAKLATRDSVPLLLHDDTFGQWSASSSLHEPNGKQVTIPLTALGAQLMRDAQLFDRHDYSVVLCEQDAGGSYVDGSNNPLHPRVKAWIDEPCEALEHFNSGASQMWVATMHGRGLLSRADEPWHVRSQLVDTLNQGALLHTTAVEEALWQSGIDILDTTKYIEEVDTSPLIRQTLIGRASTPSGEAGVSVNEGYAPDWDESKLAFAQRVAHQWRAWLLYEDLTGVVYYQDDPVNLIIKRQILALVTQATFYWTHAEATSRGYPRQVVHEASRRTVQRVRANLFRCLPATASLPMVMHRDTRGGPIAIGGDPSYENYVGSFVRPLLIHSRMAVDEHAMQILILAAILRARRRIITRTWTVNLPPWEIGPGLDVGSVVELDGENQYQVVKMAVEQLGPTLIQTTFTGEVPPSPPSVDGLGA